MGTFVASVIRDGLFFGECPRWHEGRLWYSDFFDHAVHALVPDGADERVVEVAGQPAGLGWMPDGSLLIVSMIDRRLLRLDRDGALSEHADLSTLAPFHCNDMVVDASGRAYVGNFGSDIYAQRSGATPERAPTVLIRVDPDGLASVAADGMGFPNGSIISTDGATLIVAESFGRRLTAFDIAADGSLANRRVWADLGGWIPDGICLDAAGAVWVANPFEPTVIRVAEGGETLDTVTLSQGGIACMLGGDAGDELFVVTAPSAHPQEAAASPRGRIERARVNVPHAGLP
ncbi:MAG: SMP-30/gluconolactonase/LRE family protein [Acidimicrobiales bacterium]